MKYKYTSIDLFSGPGGLCTGFKWAGVKPLIAVEMSNWTVQTYKESHNADILPLDDFLENRLENAEEFFKPNEKTLLIHGDINKVSSDLIRDILKRRFGLKKVDIVTGGAPCESFSMAGDRKEDDHRNELFMNILRIAKSIDSPMILFENVKGLLSKKKDGVIGKMFESVCDEFEKYDNDTGISYKLASRDKNKILLRACDYGVPQVRERIFLVGINKKYKSEYNYPKTTHGPNREYGYVTVNKAIDDLPHVEAGKEEIFYEFKIEDVKDPEKRKFLEQMRGISLPIPKHLEFNCGLITGHKSVNHRKQMLKRMSLIKQGESMKTAAERLIENGEEDLVKKYFPNKLYGARNRRLVGNQPSFTVTSHCLDEMIHPVIDRGLTPREAARLQSFPDWYVFEGPFVKFHGDVEQDRYEQIGDAIPPLLAYNLGFEVVKTLDKIYEEIKNNSENCNEVAITKSE